MLFVNFGSGKYYFFSALWLGLLLTNACGDATQPAHTDTSNSDGSQQNVRTVVAVSPTDRFFVSSEKSVPYYDLPGGTALGEFHKNYELNAILQVIQSSEDKSTEWSAVILHNDTVYVENRYLSTEPLPVGKTKSNTLKTPFDLYELSSFTIDNRIYRSMIILSENYDYSNHKDSVIISGSYKTGTNAGRTHELNRTYRKRFLENVGISEDDSLFLYNTFIDSLESFIVSELPLIASLSVYTEYTPYEEYDFQIGFDLGRIESPGNAYYHTFVRIEDQNPFVRNGTKEVVWKKDGKWPDHQPKLSPSDFTKLKDHDRHKTFTMSTDSLDYFINTYKDSQGMVSARHLIIYDKKGEIIFDKVFTASENTSFLSLSLESDKNNEYTQRAGKLFRDYPPVIYGMTVESFGCRHVDFIDYNTAPVSFLCDNRH